MRIAPHALPWSRNSKPVASEHCYSGIAVATRILLRNLYLQSFAYRRVLNPPANSLIAEHDTHRRYSQAPCLACLAPDEDTLEDTNHGHAILFAAAFCCVQQSQLPRAAATQNCAGACGVERPRLRPSCPGYQGIRSQVFSSTCTQIGTGFTIRVAHALLLRMPGQPGDEVSAPRLQLEALPIGFHFQAMVGAVGFHVVQRQLKKVDKLRRLRQFP